MNMIIFIKESQGVCSQSLNFLGNSNSYRSSEPPKLNRKVLDFKNSHSVKRLFLYSNWVLTVLYFLI